MSVEQQLIQQFGISFIDVSSYVGLAAAGVMTVNLLIGLLLSVQYSPVEAWPYRRLPLFAMHKWSGYAALFLVLLHPAWLPFAQAAHFSLLAVFYPIAAPEQPVFNGLGGLAAYTLIFVVVTAWMRNRFEYGFWKKLHYASYAVIMAFLIHGVFTDPSLKPGTPVDYLDGGKIFIEACAVLSVAMIAWRLTIGSRMRLVNARKSAAQILGAAPTWHGTLGVAHITDLPSDVKLFRLVNPEGGVLPFEFRAGQYLSVRLEAENRSVVRNYSICSAPQERNFCEIAVKHIHGGAGSTALHTRIDVGQHLHCFGPDGRFTFSGDDADSIVMIAGGIGVTPLLSVLKDLASSKWPGDVFLLFGVRTPADLLFEDELRSIQAAYGRLKVLVLPTSIEGYAWSGPHGFVTREILTKFVPHLEHRRVHVCGPAAMMAAVTSLLKEIGVRDAQIYTESFGSQGEVELDDDLADATVTFRKSRLTCVAPAGMTLLDAADNAGVAIESSCRVGTCGSCKVHLLDGKVKMHRDDALSGKELRANVVLACQARAMSGQVSLDA